MATAPAGAKSSTAGTTARWWAWGNISRRYPHARSEQIKDFLRHELGVPQVGAGGPAVPIGTIKVPPGRLSPADVQAIKALVTTGAVSDSREERLLHSFGRSYVDVVTARRGHIPAFTDLVVFPADVHEVEEVLRYAAGHDLAVVPWGGGTSVVGGVDPERGEHRAVLTLSLQRLMDPQGMDEVSHLAKFQCGILGPELEKSLNSRGFTLGHFPQSFEFSSLGGWLATRSSGQASTRNGEVVDRLHGATVVTPVGTFRWERGSSESSGPDPAALFPGSEGTLGIFVEATLAVDRLPVSTSYRGALFPDWECGLQAIRELAQSHPAPAVLRLADPAETVLTMAGRPPAETLSGRMRERLEPQYLGLRRLEEGAMCFAVTGYEGNALEVRHGEARRREVLHKLGGVDVGSGAGESWRRERFLLPYLRDDLLEDGWLVETLETGAAWSELDSVKSQVEDALKSAARRGKFPILTAAHLSHGSNTGSGLYFTLIAPQSPTDPVGQWLALKEAATEAILKAGGVLSHHHGVGRMHAPWIASYRKGLGRAALRPIKTSLDPAGVLNPGKTLPDQATPPTTAKSAPPPTKEKEKEKEPKEERPKVDKSERTDRPERSEKPPKAKEAPPAAPPAPVKQDGARSEPSGRSS